MSFAVSVVCRVKYRTVLRPADQSSRGILSSVVCLIECDREDSIMKGPWPSRGCCSI